MNIYHLYKKDSANEYEKFLNEHLYDKIKSTSITCECDTKLLYLVEYESNLKVILHFKIFTDDSLKSMLENHSPVEIKGVYFKGEIIEKLYTHNEIKGICIFSNCLFANNQALIMSGDIKIGFSFKNSIFMNGISVNGNREVYKTTLDNITLSFRNINIINGTFSIHDLFFTQSVFTIDNVMVKDECLLNKVTFSNMQWLEIGSIHTGIFQICDSNFDFNKLYIELLKQNCIVNFNGNRFTGNALNINFGTIAELINGNNTFQVYVNLSGNTIKKCIISRCIINETYNFYIKSIESIFFYETIVNGKINLDWDKIYGTKAIEKFQKNMYKKDTIGNANLSIAEGFKQVYFYHKQLNNIKHQDTAYIRWKKYSAKAYKTLSKHFFKKIHNIFQLHFKGYTRYWYYVLFINLIIIFVFAILGYYNSFMSEGKEILAFGKSIYFSLVTFSTLGYGDISPIQDFSNSFASIAGIEGFIGAALNAVFIVVLTRRLLD